METCVQNGLLCCLDIDRHNTPMTSTSQIRANCWSVTINNPTAEDMEALSVANAKPGWSVKGQLEVGESGTPHYQLMVKSPQVRWSAVKRIFPRGHIEPARNAAALAEYVAKQDSRVAALPTQSRYYPTLTAFYALVLDYFTEVNWLNADPATWFPLEPSRWFKDAPHQDPEEDYMRRLSRREAMVRAVETDLLNWEEAIEALIERGYHIEHYWFNPQIKGAVRRFGWSVLKRSLTETNRQTDNARQIASVSVPVMVHNHATSDEEAPSDASSPPSPRDSPNPEPRSE